MLQDVGTIPQCCTYNANANAYITGFYKLNGCIPWADMAENPTSHFTSGSWPNCDYRLEEPSHMKSMGINTLLGHWLRLTKKGKQPLVLKKMSDQLSDTPAKSLGKGKKKATYIDTDEMDKENQLDEEQNAPGTDQLADKNVTIQDDIRQSNSEQADTPMNQAHITSRAMQDAPTPPVSEGSTGSGTDKVPDGKTFPPSPRSTACSQQTWMTFLKFLTDNKQYHRLLSLLGKAKACILLPYNIVNNFVYRLAIYYQPIPPPGCHGCPRTTIYLRHSMNTIHRPVFQPFTDGP